MPRVQRLKCFWSGLLWGLRHKGFKVCRPTCLPACSRGKCPSRRPSMSPSHHQKSMKMVRNSAFFCSLFLIGSFACNDLGPKASEKTVRIYGTYCARCHEVGAANSPKKGDVDAWKKRFTKGQEALVDSVKTGLVAMPPNGDCNECSDVEFRDLILYMSR